MAADQSHSILMAATPHAVLLDHAEPRQITQSGYFRKSTKTKITTLGNIDL
jgi:hypothetical protein